MFAACSSRPSQRVVARRRPDKRSTGQGHRFARADVLVPEGRGAAGSDASLPTTPLSVRSPSPRRAVIDLVRRGEAARDRFAVMSAVVVPTEVSV